MATLKVITGSRARRDLHSIYIPDDATFRICRDLWRQISLDLQSQCLNAGPVILVIAAAVNQCG
jgi:hypothetical protein